MGTQFSFSSQVSQAEQGSQVRVNRLHFWHGPHRETQIPGAWQSSHGPHLRLQKPQLSSSAIETHALLQSISPGGQQAMPSASQMPSPQHLVPGPQQV